MGRLIQDPPRGLDMVRSTVGRRTPRRGLDMVRSTVGRRTPRRGLDMVRSTVGRFWHATLKIA